MFEHERIKDIGVIGAGGVGFYLALILNRERFGRSLTVYDDDDFEGGRGHERLPRVHDRKTLKVNHLRNFSLMAMGDQFMTVKTEKLTPEMLKIGDWTTKLLVDCTDMAIDQRRPLYDAIVRAGAQYLRVSYDGAVGVGVFTGLPLGARPGGGYVEVPTLAQSFWAGGLGAQAVHDILNGKQVEDTLHEKPGKKFHSQAAGEGV